MSKPEEDLEDVKDEKKRKKEKSTVQTKVVIRRLPVGMNKTQFLEQFEPLPEHDFFRFVSGDRSLAPNNFPRAYINFVSLEDIVTFRDTYDGCELQSQAGLTSTCVVEYAPFQKVVRKGRKKEDPKVNTIEKDADYIKFLETLKENDEKQSIDVEKFLEELDLRDKQNQKPLETPLTTFVKQRREERKRLREERKKLEIERRKKKEDERRKKREAERKKKELEKSKRKDKNDHEIDGKKTLGETRREMQENNRIKQNSESKDDVGNKIKLLQKKDGIEPINKSKGFKEGVFAADDLERCWADDYTVTWPGLEKFIIVDGPDPSLKQNYDGESRPARGHKDYRSRAPPRDHPPRRWKDDYQRPVSARNKEANSKDAAANDDKYKNKKPDREIYSSSGRGGGRGGYRGGRGGARPVKYSEQRNRRPSENEK